MCAVLLSDCPAFGDTLGRGKLSFLWPGTSQPQVRVHSRVPQEITTLRTLVGPYIVDLQLWVERSVAGRIPVGEPTPCMLELPDSLFEVIHRRARIGAPLLANVLNLPHQHCVVVNLLTVAWRIVFRITTPVAPAAGDKELSRWRRTITLDRTLDRLVKVAGMTSPPYDASAYFSQY